MIEEAKSIIEAVGEGEQEKFDNLTEGLQAGERGQRMEEVAGDLADSCFHLLICRNMLNDILALDQAQE